MVGRIEVDVRERNGHEDTGAGTDARQGDGGAGHAARGRLRRGGVSTDAEARQLLATGRFGVLIIGGGVEPASRAAMKELAAEYQVRRVIDGALTEPFDAYVRRAFEPLIRETAAADG
ncbi:hypothetical protein GCM10020295_77130 [Streptomyces cinereospinus]